MARLDRARCVNFMHFIHRCARIWGRLSVLCSEAAEMFCTHTNVLLRDTFGFSNCSCVLLIIEVDASQGRRINN